MNSEEIKVLMNEYGKLKKPFLFAIDFEKENSIFIPNPLQQHEVLFRVGSYSNISDTVNNSPNAKINLIKEPISFDEYDKRFNIVMNGLKRGDSFLTNLTVKTPIYLNCNLEDICYMSNSPFVLLVKNKFISFSPEKFVIIDKNFISTYPMKGTIRADEENAHEKILSDEKETAEHYTIVDLMRNDLGIVSNNIKVTKFRYIDNIKTNTGSILQVSSEIKGELECDYLEHLGDIITNMLPAGSVSGAPKEATLEIISKAEKEKRGFYTGVFGYFDGIKLESAVLIRFISQENNKYFFHSGGGITINSNSSLEYSEVLDKVYLPFS